MTKLIIFDCDGVLIDSEILVKHSQHQAFADQGFSEVTLDWLKEHTLGHGWDSILNLVENLSGRPASKDTPLQAKNIYDNIPDEQIFSFLNLPETITKLKANYKICVASGAEMQKINRSLRIAKIDYFFPEQDRFSATMVPRGKPAPDLFLHATEKMKTDPTEAIVIEDSLAGVQAALSAGIKVFGFCGASHSNSEAYKEMLRDAGAHEIFDDFANLPALIDKYDD